MRVYRVLAGAQPSTADFLSYAEAGKPLPPRSSDALRRRWRAVSAFTTLGLAADRAAKYGLGEWYAALELPDEVELEVGREQAAGGAHVSIHGQTAASLLGHVVEVGRLQLPDQGLELGR
ncbi:MAG: hypothetical protein WCB85_14780 [Candidatus Dormiibacterota bacterium]